LQEPSDRLGDPVVSKEYAAADLVGKSVEASVVKRGTARGSRANPL